MKFTSHINGRLLSSLVLLTAMVGRGDLQAESNPALDLARQLNQAFIAVADRVSPSVVVIEVARKRNYHNFNNSQDSFWDLLPEEFKEQFRKQYPEEREEPSDEPLGRQPIFDARGSGVIIRKEGFILTNRHVVDGAERIRVRLLNGNEYMAEIQGEDIQADIAVLKIDAPGLKAIAIGDSDKTRVGEFAIAIGAPFDLDYSVTFGHVSAKGRSRIIQDGALDQDFIQTDANINPGNSGGPLVNIDGEIIGVNTLIRGLRSGIGFAVPINLAMEVAEKLISDGKYVRSWLGVAIDSLRNNRDYRALVTELQDGVVVTGISSNGPAWKSDLKANDIITAVDGSKVMTPTDLKAAIRSKPAGKPVTLDVHRLAPVKNGDFRGENIKVEITPEPWPEILTATFERPRSVTPPPAKGKIMGMTVETLTESLAEQYRAGDIEGVIVTEVESGSEASLKGVRPGDIITEVNQKAVTSPSEFMEVMQEADLKKGVIVNFTSRGTSRFLILKESGD